jgi:hypothetical protein
MCLVAGFATAALSVSQTARVHCKISDWALIPQPVPMHDTGRKELYPETATASSSPMSRKALARVREPLQKG